jgi:tetratricopeptide (TPR) repeat protein
MKRLRFPLVLLFLALCVVFPFTVMADDDDDDDDGNATRTITIDPDSFAAIAYSPSAQEYYYAFGHEDRWSAEKAALSVSKAKDTKIVAWVNNGFIALALGDEKEHWGYATTYGDGASADEAAKNAVGECNKRTTHAYIALVLSSDGQYLWKGKIRRSGKSDETAPKPQSRAKIIRNPDGSSYEVREDGTEITTLANGSTVEKRPNGTEIIKNANGSSRETRPDGTRIIKNPDGSSVEKRADGTEIVINKNGSSVEKRADGTKIVRNPDGSGRETRPDGTKITMLADGGRIESKPDGTEIVIDADGSSVETRSDGTQISIDVDGTRVEIKPDGTKTTTKVEPPVSPSAGFEPKVRQLVKQLEYPDQLASDLLEIVRPWKCDDLCQKLTRAAREVAQKKMSAEECAELEKQAAYLLAQRIRNQFYGVDTKVGDIQKYFDLAAVLADKKANCVGYAQLFYVLGNSMGLTSRGTDVLRRAQGVLLTTEGHIACIVELHNGEAIQVDLGLGPKEWVSKPFVFTKQYVGKGNYWALNDDTNVLGVHARVQLLDGKGLAAIACKNRGIAYRGAGQPDKAIIEFTKATQFNPKCASAYQARADVYSDLRQHEKAILDYTKAIELDPTLAPSYSNRAHSYTETGQQDKAIVDASKAIELDPQFAAAYNNRGNAYLKAGENGKAVADYTKAIELEPKHAFAYGNRGAAHRLAGRWNEAVSDSSKAIELYPKYVNAYINRGLAHAKLGNAEDARKDLRTAIQLNPAMEDTIKKMAAQARLSL